MADGTYRLRVIDNVFVLDQETWSVSRLLRVLKKFGLDYNNDYGNLLYSYFRETTASGIE